MVDIITVVIDAAKDNNGNQTVIQTTLAAGTKFPPHYHTLFHKTFTVISGQIKLYNGTEELLLQTGESSTVKKNEIHSYEICATETIVHLTFNPGNINFEKAIKIIIGEQVGNYFEQLNMLENNNLPLMAVIADLTNSIFVGEIGFKLKKFLLTENGKNTELLKQELIKKYCDDIN